MNIKGMYIGKYREQATLYSYCKENSKKIKSDLQQLPKKLAVLNAKPRQRNKLKTDYGLWFVLHANNWAYGLCTCVDYPERHAYKLIEEIKQFIENHIDINGKEFEKQLKKVVQDHCHKYEELSKIDKVYQANEQVGKLKQQLQTGIQKIISHQEHLTDLDERAQEMKFYAKQFETKCTTLEKITFWAKWKFILIIIAVCLGLVSFIAIILMIKV